MITRKNARELVLVDGEYSGDFKGELRDGWGLFRNARGDVYEGEWKNDSMHGWGSMKYAAGAQYEGEWACGCREGRGTLTCPGGDKFAGEWACDELLRGVWRSPGTNNSNSNSSSSSAPSAAAQDPASSASSSSATSKDGDVYEGEFSNGKREGKGVYGFGDGRVYDGQWKAGLRHGRGRMVYPDGSVYSGQWKADMRDGRGLFRHPSGDVYSGEYRADKRDGRGSVVFANSGLSFQGTFRNGVRCGVGVFACADGRTLRCEWRDDAPDPERPCAVLTSVDNQVITKCEWKVGATGPSGEKIAVLEGRGTQMDLATGEVSCVICADGGLVSESPLTESPVVAADSKPPHSATGTPATTTTTTTTAATTSTSTTTTSSLPNSGGSATSLHEATNSKDWCFTLSFTHANPCKHLRSAIAQLDDK
ncbi:2-isopropylmalate synthase [Pelomyxa schiedti]|nr:2-isopropylmalate synthase [Pelomyxa schiedti]